MSATERAKVFSHINFVALEIFKSSFLIFRQEQVVYNVAAVVLPALLPTAYCLLPTALSTEPHAGSHLIEGDRQVRTNKH